MKKILFILILLFTVGFGAVTHINDSTATNTGTSLTVTCSAFTLTGDLLIAVITKDDDPTFDDEAGWNTITKAVAAPGDAQAYVSICWFVATGDGAQAFTWDNGDSEPWYGVIATFRGQDTSTPIHGSPDAYSADNDTPSVLTGSSYTSLTTGSIAVAAFGSDRARVVTNTDADFINDVILSNAGGSGGTSLGMSYTNTISGTGTTTECDFTLAGADEWRVAEFVIEAEFAAGWTGTFMGVTDPAKVFDQDVSGISEVMGVP